MIFGGTAAFEQDHTQFDAEGLELEDTSKRAHETCDAMHYDAERHQAATNAVIDNAVVAGAPLTLADVPAKRKGRK
jgi:hypothetical protein